MIRENLKELNPELDFSGNLRFPKVEEALNEKVDVNELLNKLSSVEILHKKFFDKIAICPNCDSKNVSVHYHCPNCGSLNIEKKVLLEHLSCGTIDNEERFKEKGNYVCPGCGRELGEGARNLRRVGSWFQCGSCNTKFDEPLMKHFCRTCKKEFGIREIKLENIYSYALNPIAEGEFKKSFMLLAPMKSMLESLQYRVSMPGSLVGGSGAEHNFDMIALKENREKMEVVVVDVVSSNDVVDETPVATMFAKVFDVKPTKAFLVAIPRMNESGKKLSQLYGIEVIEAKNVEEASSKVLESLGGAPPSLKNPAEN